MPGDAQDRRAIPSTPMTDRYAEVHAVAEPGVSRRPGDRTGLQRELAERDRSSVADLAADFLGSLALFTENYRPRRGESFHDGRLPLGEKWHEPGSPITNRLAARMERVAQIETAGKLPSPLTYVDRELVPSRTTGERDRDEGTLIRLDLLLESRSQPIVAEVKALGDENAHYALIQGLAACTQLAPPAQRERLHDAYADLSPTGPMEVWIVLSQHNSRGDDKAAMLELSREIAGELFDFPDICAVLSAIRCVDAQLPEAGPVHMSERWSAEAQL